MDPVRELLERLMREKGDDCFSISRLLGRNAAYFQQYLKRGVPRRLKEEDRRVLARYFGVDEVELGGPPAPVGAGFATVRVPRLQLGASAGAGALADGEEPNGAIAFEGRWLRRLTTQPDALSIIQVAGDSMEPTLLHGDDILVDASDAEGRLREGIYVIRMDDALMVKRLALAPGRKISVLSDNPAYPGWSDVDPGSLRVIGRVIWTGRRIG
jgi:Peptidase S24-like